MLGGGYVGLELAQAYRRFGSRVTIIETGRQFASREDPDIAEALLEALRDEGIEVLLGANVLRVEGRSGERVTLTIEAPTGERKLEGSDILVAVGRTPNTQGVGLDRAGVTVDARGYANASKRARTASGRSASAPAARNSPTRHSTISASYETISPAARAARAIGSFLIASSPIRRSPVSG